MTKNLAAMGCFEREMRVRNLLEQVRDEYFPELRGREFHVEEIHTNSIFLGINNDSLSFSRPYAYFPVSVLKGDLGHELSHIVLDHSYSLNNERYSLDRRYYLQIEEETNEETKRRGLAENLQRSEDLLDTLQREGLVTREYRVVNELELARYLCDLAEQEEK